VTRRSSRTDVDDATAAANIQAALRALPGMSGNVNVTVVTATEFDITFTNSLGNRNIGSLLGGGLVVGGGASVTEQSAGTVTTNEVQRLTFVNAPVATDAFSLNFEGRFTPTVNYGANSAAAAAAMQTALESLPGLSNAGRGGLNVTELTVGSGTANEVQRLTFSNTPTATTTFALNFNGQYTANIPYGANQTTAASNIQAALLALPGMTGSVAVTAVSATQFNITFSGSLANQNISSLVGGSLVVGGGATVTEQIAGNGTTNEVQRLTFAAPPVSTDVFALNFNGGLPEISRMVRIRRRRRRTCRRLCERYLEWEPTSPSPLFPPPNSTSRSPARLGIRISGDSSARAMWPSQMSTPKRSTSPLAARSAIRTSVDSSAPAMSPSQMFPIPRSTSPLAVLSAIRTSRDRLAPALSPYRRRVAGNSFDIIFGGAQGNRNIGRLIGTGNVAVASVSSTAFDITFGGALGKQNMDRLIGTGSVAVSSVTDSKFNITFGGNLGNRNIERLIGAGNVAVSSSLPGTVFDVTFGGSLGRQNIGSLLSADNVGHGGFPVGVRYHLCRGSRQ